MDVKRRRAHFIASLDSLRGSSVKIGTIQRRLAWPLRKDDTHKSRSVNNSLTTAWLRQPLPFVPGQAVCDRCVAWRARASHNRMPTHARKSRTPATSARARPQQTLTHALLVAKAGEVFPGGRPPPKMQTHAQPTHPATGAHPRPQQAPTHMPKAGSTLKVFRAVPHPSADNAHAGARAPCQQPAKDGKRPA